MSSECKYSIESRICAKSFAASGSGNGPRSTMRLKSSSAEQLHNDVRVGLVEDHLLEPHDVRVVKFSQDVDLCGRGEPTEGEG